MTKKKFIGLLAGLLCSQMAAAMSLSFVPVNQTKNLGDNLSVGVMLNDRGNELISGYDIEVGYSASILQLLGVDYGTGLNFGNPADSYADNLDSWVFETSYLDEATLATQDDDFLLFTLNFKGIGVGTSDLLFTWAGLSGSSEDDGFGGLVARNISTALDTSGTGSVTILGGGGGPNPVPLPAAAWLFGSALLGFAGFSRAKKNT